MAVDEAILESVGGSASPPTLRLYAWEPACLSLGYAQPSSDVDFSRLHARGWGIVRRPTGGRAVLHTDELTYSVIAPHSEPRVAGTVLESYRRLAAALVEALRLLSLPVTVQEHSEQHAAKVNPVCFEIPSTYEITVDGKKLIGSAQARKKEGVLQHGSLPLTGDLTRIVQALTFSSQAARQSAASRLLERATTVEAALGRRTSWEAAARACAAGFRSALALDFQPANLSTEENSRAEELMIAKYDHLDWNKKPES